MNDHARNLRDAALALDRGDLSNAHRGLRTVLAANPDHSGALAMLAVVIMRQGDFDEAEATIQRALKINKRDPNVLSISAMILKAQGKTEQALDKLDRALRFDPRNPRMLNNRGTLLKDLGQYERAIKDFDAALAINQNYLAARGNKAGALAALGRHDRALQLYDAIVGNAPNFAAGWLGRGLSQMDLGRLDNAAESFSRAIELDGRDPNGHFNLGNALLAAGQVNEAVASYDRAIALESTFAEAHYNRGNALRSLGKFEEAAAAYRETTKLRPDHFGAFANLGGVLTELLLLDDAVVAFNAALAIKPGYADALYNKSIPLLLRADFDEGWKAYEHRKSIAVPLGARSFKQPAWLGDRDIAGKTVLVHWEQGLGDTIQFSRYVSLLGREGARMLFAPQKSLHALMKGLRPEADLVDVDDVSLKFDFHCPLLSLPMALGTRLENIPAATGYLKAEPDRVERWRRRLGEGIKIGVAWRGSAFGASVGRSAPRSLFEALHRPGIRLISLQKLDDGDPPIADPIEDLGAEFDVGRDAFLDAAAVIKNLDLVISVDTAIAHLAGALGAKIWIALKRSPDWRWLLDRSDSPWYPTARLFRQSKIGDWRGTFSEIAASLENEFPT